MEFIAEEDERVQKLFESCFDNWCFADFYNNRNAATSVEDVEKYIRFVLEDWALHMREELDDDELSSGDKKDLEIYEQAEQDKTSYLYAWNRIYCDNGETHGTVVAMCFKSREPILHALGRKILLDLAEIQSDEGGDDWLSFDT